jgi:hypothetical protein
MNFDEVPEATFFVKTSNFRYAIRDIVSCIGCIQTPTYGTL